MSSIRIRNIGPIKDTGNIFVSPILLLIGKQGAGKSTVLQILCQCQWIEKTCMLGSFEEMRARYHNAEQLRKDLIEFHHIGPDFFYEGHSIIYDGDCIKLTLEGDKINLLHKRNDYKSNLYAEKIALLPAERHLMHVIHNLNRTYTSTANDSLYNHISEWDEVQQSSVARKQRNLVVSPEVSYFFDATTGGDTLQLNGSAITFSPQFAASGIQSALSIEVFADFLQSVYGQDVRMSYVARANLKKELGLNTEQVKLPERLAKYQTTRMFIEEPEQNLFPESQWRLVMYLVHTLRAKSAYSAFLTMTTHSPYILMALNILLSAAQAFKKNSAKTKPILEQYNIPLIQESDISAYYVADGTLSSIVYKGKDFPTMIEGVKLDIPSQEFTKLTDLFDQIIYA